MAENNFSEKKGQKMKTYSKLWRKMLALGLLLLCLGWMGNDRTNTARATSDCDACIDERAACRLECGSGNQSCLDDCETMFRHCMLFCDGS